MTPALLAAAAAGAVLLWPDGRAVVRDRLQRVAPAAARSGAVRPVPLPVAAAVLGGGAAALVSTGLVALLAAGGAALAARGWRARRGVAAADARLSALVELLAAFAAELRAGRSMEEAVRGAVADCPDDACAAALVRAVRAPMPVPPGPPTIDGTAAALDRLSSAVALSARTGCSLAAVVSAVEDDLRARQRWRRELLVATAGPRASARLLAGLPLLGLAMGSGVGADPWQVLTRTGTGQVLLVVGVLLEVAGIAWTGRLVRGIGR